MFEELQDFRENPETVETRELGGNDLEEAALLEPELVELPGVGEVLVGGDAFEIGERLEDDQGDNFYNFQGDCGLVTVLNILTMGDIHTSEDEVVGRAIILGECEYSELYPPESNGGTSVFQRQRVLGSYGISSSIFDARSEAGSLESLAAYAEAGHGVNISVNSGYAWGNPNFIGDGNSNHSILVTGGVWDKDTGQLKGLMVCDSGLVGQESGAVYLSKEVLQDAYLEAGGTTALVTDKPIRC